MTDKDKYRLLCHTEPSIPLFSRDWWLDIVCGKDKWDVLWIEQKGQVQATLPLYVPYKGVVSMPPLTQTMGPWFAPVSGDTKYASELGQRQKLCKTFIDKLKIYSHFLQNFHYDITDWLPFYWEGYRQSTRYTYILEGLEKLKSPVENESSEIWGNMSSHTRRNIIKAKEKRGITVRKGIPADDFQRIYAKTFERQGKSHAPHIQLLASLIHACRERGQGNLWGGYDADGNLHATAFIAWQESSAYYIAGGGDPAYRDSGAHSLIMWEAIRFVADKSKQFDFEGSMIPGVERFFREFGARQIPYFTIFRGNFSLFYKAWFKLRNLL